MRAFLRGLAAVGASLVVTACVSGTPAPTVTATVTVTAGPGLPSPPAPGKPYPTPRPTTTAVPVGKRPVVAPDGRTCPDHPTPACTGAPPGVRLKETVLNDGNSYRVDLPGRRLDGLRIKGDLVVLADDVVITNSVIEGRILNEKDRKHKRFTIADSTVGPEQGCDSLPAIGDGEYTAVRVHVRNHGDGIRDAGDDIVVMDSFIDLCSNPKDHSDGIQGYTAGRNLVFDHNTIDQRDVPDHNAPIFFPRGQSPRAANVTMTNNLVMGGTFSIQLWEIAGHAVFRNNLLVDGTWDYRPVEAECARIDWRDNRLVTIDSNYVVTGEAGPLPCMG
ncbi:hypothetical protein [Nonomuraea longicatena]|uniref:Right handed beta helix domain-containing protein n=1 Tax=Nonomuraea longicatena TaxID=83682 RepID=A0ABP4BNT6_9ACTN